MGGDQAIEVVDCSAADRDLRQALEIFERDGFATLALLASAEGTIQCTRDTVQQLGHRSGFNVGLVDCAAEERASQRAFLHIRLFGKPGELGCVLRIERDVQSLRRRHSSIIARNRTERVSRRKVSAVLRRRVPSRV